MGESTTGQRWAARDQFVALPLMRIHQLQHELVFDPELDELEDAAPIAHPRRPAFPPSNRQYLSLREWRDNVEMDLAVGRGRRIDTNLDLLLAGERLLPAWTNFDLSAAVIARTCNE